MVLQLVIAARLPGAPHDVSVGVLRGASLPGRFIRVLSFFTIQSNLLIGLVSAQLAADRHRDGTRWRVVRLAALFGITVTGIVYSTVLARIHQPNGADETVVNTLVHYIVPVLAVLGWVVFGPRPRIGRPVVLWSLLFPVLWLAYTLVRGAVWDWYPYPFLDVTTHGYARVVLNSVFLHEAVEAGLVTALFGAVASVFAFGDRRLSATGQSVPSQPRGSGGETTQPKRPWT